MGERADIPRPGKVILLSDYFDVTTVYLLKGIEPFPKELTEPKDKHNAHIFSTEGTAFNLMGIIVSAMVRYGEQVATATAIGLIFLVMGCMIYGIGMSLSDEATKPTAKQRFLSINVWTVTFIPLSVAFNMLLAARVMAPYPVIVNPLTRFASFWLIYLAVCIITDLKISRNQK